jgi:hypothetical protein
VGSFFIGALGLWRSAGFCGAVGSICAGARVLRWARENHRFFEKALHSDAE